MSHRAAIVPAAAILCTLVPAQAGPYPDTRLEAYQFPANSRLARVAEAVLFHYGRANFVPRPDGSYDLAVSPRTHAGSLGPLCSTATYFGQPQATGGNVATLVGSRHVLLADHALPSGATASTRAFVFGYELKGPPGPPVPTFHFAEGDVYFGEEIVARDAANDWALVRLHRDVPPSRRPLILRELPSLVPGDPAVILGFPEHIPLKGQSVTVFSAGVGANVWQVVTDSLVREGSSGGPLVGARTGTIEGVLRSGSFPYVFEGTCGGWLDDLSQQWGAVANFPVGATALLPPIGLQVLPAPESVFDHFGPPGGPFSQTDSTVHLSCPATSRPVGWTASAIDIARVGLVGPFTIQPRKSVGGTLQPSTAVSTTKLFSNVAAWTQAPGIHEARVQFSDSTYSATSLHVHRFHAGVDGLVLDPATGVGTEGPGAPPTTQSQYVLTNRHIVSQTVLVEPNASWIRVNGATTAVLNLGPSLPGSAPGMGQANIAFDVTGLLPGVYAGDIRFRPALPAGFEDPPNPEIGALHRAVRVDVGRRIFGAADTPTSFAIPGSATLTVVVDQPLQVADLDLGIHVTAASPRTRITLQITSPSGVSTVIHRMSIADFEPLNTIFDDETNAPNLGSLGSFDGLAAMGSWQVTVLAVPSDPAETSMGVVQHIALRITPAP